MSVENKVFRLRSCIALVHRAGSIEFFDSNLRVGFSIELEYSGIVELLHQFDGVMTVASIGDLYPEVLLEELCSLVVYFVPASGCSFTSENFKLTFFLTIANSVYVMDTERKRYHNGIVMSLTDFKTGVTNARKFKRETIHRHWRKNK